jgi:hypothetical protein
MLLRGRMLKHALSVASPFVTNGQWCCATKEECYAHCGACEWLHATFRHPMRSQKTLVTIGDYKGPFVAVRFTKPLLCHCATPARMRWVRTGIAYVAENLTTA